MPSENYRPTNKTVVTEIKSFTVDAVRKVSAFRSTSASKVNLDTSITQEDVNVGDDGYQIDDISTLVGISSVNSFIVELTQTKETVTYPVVNYTGDFTGTVTSINPGDNIDITLTDEDLTASTVSVTVTNLDTGEIEGVVLYRQGTSHTYKRTIYSVDSAVVGTNHDQNMHVQVGHTLEVSYSDSANTNSNPETITHSISVDPIQTYTGILKLDDKFTLGSTLRVQVYDPDESGTVNVSVFNQRSTQTENLVLTETSPGLFVFDLPTFDSNTALANDSGVMNAVTGDTLVGTYIDSVNASGNPETINHTITVGTPIYETGTVSILGSLKAGTPITLQVSDYDRNTSVSVTVVNQTTNETETVILPETTPLSGVFEAELPTTIGEDIWYAGTDEDGSMVVKAADVIRVTYNDPIASTQLPFAVVETATILEPDPEPAGPNPIITEEDHVIEMEVKNLFYVNGNMPNTTIKIKKTNTEADEYIRCSLLVV